MPGAPKPVGNFGLIPAVWQQLGQTINTLQGQTKALNQGARQTNLVDGNGNTQVINGNLAQTVTIGASFGQAGVQVGTALTNTAGIAVQQDLATTMISTTHGSTSATVASATGLDVGMVIGAATPSNTVASGSNGGTIANVASWSNPSAGVLDVASTDGFAPSGALIVSTSTGTAEVTYTAITGTSFTGCAYVSGSGTVATGGTVTSPQSPITPGTTISAISGTSVTLSQNAAATATSHYSAACNWTDLATIAQWIITGSGPPTSPPPGSVAGVLYLDIQYGALYQWTEFSGVGGWAGVGGQTNPANDFTGPYVAQYPSNPSVTLAADLNDSIIVASGTISIASTTVEVFADTAEWKFDADGGLKWPAADDLGFFAGTVYSTQGVPSNTIGVAGDWCLSQNGNVYFNDAGTWVIYAGGGGAGGWLTDTVASITAGSPNTVDLTTSGYTGVACLASYTPNVGNTVLVALNTTYGSSPFPVVVGALDTTGSQTGPSGTPVTVPSGVTSIQFSLWGSAGQPQGAGSGGAGATLVATISVVPLSTFTPYYHNAVGGAAGGGGHANSGGAAADVRIGGTSLSNRVLVAAGGGGDGENWTTSYAAGGSGGGTTGQAGEGGPLPNGGGGGGAGTPSTGGAAGTDAGTPGSPSTAGTLGAGGAPGDGSGAYNYGGGGGDGYYGGGGGGAAFGSNAGGGGGGSDYWDPSITIGTPTDTQGGNSSGGPQAGKGLITWTYL